MPGCPRVIILVMPPVVLLFYTDFPALAIVVILSLVLMRSTKESSLLNMIVVGVHIVLIVFVICAGKTRSS